MKAVHRGKRIELVFQYDPRIITFVKSLQGRQYHAGTRTWSIPFSGSMRSVEKLCTIGFEVPIELIHAVMDEDKRLAGLQELARSKDTVFETALPAFPYQKVAARFVLENGSAIIGDEMGLGKTIESLLVVENVHPQRTIIFCPSVLKWQWESEIKKFLPTYLTQVIDGNKAQRTKQWQLTSFKTIVIANYELLLQDLKEMCGIEWDVLIADEATRIANPHAKSSKAIKKLKAKRRIPMTGTLISNRAQEVWNLVDLVEPGALGNYYEFIDRYCVKNHWGAISSYKNMDELKVKLQQFMIRRTKAEVLPELPPKIQSDITVKLSPEEKALYDKIRKEILFEIAHEDISKLENPMTIQYTLVKMTRLRQLTSSLELLGTNTKSSKLEVLKELCGTAITEGKKAIVFTQFADMADVIERELADWGVCKISGRIEEEYRDVVARFNTDESKRILVMTSAGQFGLNIQRASILFHYDQEWSLAKMQQREGRAHRYGQKDTVQIYNLLAKGTVDMYVRKILHGKAELSSQLLDNLPITMGDIQDMLNYEE